MYYMLECLSPADGYIAAVEYRDDDPMRNWSRGRRFSSPPPVPLHAKLRMRNKSVLAEMWMAPLPLMSVRLHDALRSAGVDNLDVYPAVLENNRDNVTLDGYVAFNLIGAIAAADLARSRFDAPDGPLISVDFDGVSISAEKARGALMFRLAEAVNGVVVHEHVKRVVEASGIDTLTFMPPELWAG